MSHQASEGEVCRVSSPTFMGVVSLLSRENSERHRERASSQNVLASVVKEAACPGL